ncbi:MAG TPA: hypothetical protein VFO52_01925 [Longimicrobiales bacterium]|nr:hypothetical protein [Longimicrobiales bacterium]
MRTQLYVVAALTLAAVAPAEGQTVTLDEGSFRISVGGREVGTEVFSIRQNGSGQNAVIIAVGRVVLDSDKGPQELSSELQVAGATLRPAAYEVRVQGASAEQIKGRVVGGRFSAQIVSPAGEQMREYLAGEGAVVADEGVAHQYYFMARRADGKSTRMPVIIPRLNRQVVADVRDSGPEKIAIAGRSFEARKYTISPAGQPAREIWVDAEGRVLRLEIPDRKFVAQRVAAPN